ncbi:gamma-glutamyl-gamma-aminobutyrate hydrolase family protein [Kibdelosporangium aridum]|uniref:Gamma-glutamyl-gamma-aminobutyrate hydrolase family protein n=1 Tax=Kibdelosporangium aridum TaxID=2030 RepID=A0A428Y3P6_KIBAR|nr:gamma-glutamyl-gamma-aminobutyrate hydrolase family protein [Kibdelosporangium aridum]RSM62192.1 gamma-glutamyl-gamma-aminobutyrate hydrolase family protein [Kibdelosporangium aridum]
MVSNGSRVPLIGITTYLEQAKFGLWELPSAVLMRSYLDSIVAAGGMPVMLPPVGRWLPEHMSHLDGLVLSGGADIDPSRYGQAPHAATGTLRLERDTSEFGLFHLALEADVPVLGVCRGLQLINIALGGTLHQHVPEVAGSDSHNPSPGVFGTNDIKLAPDSVVANLVGEQTIVHCHHHQAIDQLGSGLTAVGWAQDGTIEAVELAEAGFVIGVQWHPEENHTDVRLFQGLVQAAIRRKSQ